MRFRTIAGAAAISLACGAASSAAARGPQAASELPDGPGRKILETSCTACHDLTEVTKFKGYYTRDEWRDIVRTMIEYGAKVKSDEVDVLVDYLAKHLGKQPG
jgi:cytochrome c5